MGHSVGWWRGWRNSPRVVVAGASGDRLVPSSEAPSSLLACRQTYARAAIFMSPAPRGLVGGLLFRELSDALDLDQLGQVDQRFVAGGRVCTRLLGSIEAVAQTLSEAVRSFLRVVSEIRRCIRHARRVCPAVGTPTRAGGRLSDRAAAFPRRLYATASIRCD
jgi:hypothetical protein